MDETKPIIIKTKLDCTNVAVSTYSLMKLFGRMVVDFLVVQVVFPSV